MNGLWIRIAGRCARPVALVASAASLLAACSAAAHAPPRTQPGPSAHALRVLAFTDTASVRIELEIREAAALHGAPVRAEITEAAPGAGSAGAASGSGARLWAGELGRLEVGPDRTARLSARVKGLRPRLWSLESPTLYHLTVTVGSARNQITSTTRIGFRSFVARDGRLYLNGRPIFLRGNAINPPDRNLPDSLSENRAFAADYIGFLKQIGVNAIRLSRTSQVWLDVADELGMLVFQGHYGTPPGGTSTSPPKVPFEESLRHYKEEILGPQVNHPSVVIYVLSNEQAAPEIPYLKRGAAEIEQFLTRTYRALREWDDTRAYIGNAGYGFGRSGDICDLHRYWGWYYNSFLSFYTLRDPRVCWRSDRPQPITLTENVGSYTGPDGRFNLVPRSKQPESQVNWTGHAPWEEQAERSLAYQAFLAKQAIEITRRIRSRNPYLAGLMPFTILFHRWAGIGSFADMGPKPVARQFAVSFQPVLLSWELWQSQVYAGSEIRPVAHVVNDADDGAALEGVRLEYRLTGADGAVHHEATVDIGDVPYFAAVSRRLSIRLPDSLATGSYTLSGRLVEKGRTVSRNETTIFVGRRDFATSSGGPRIARRVRVYDPEGATQNALRALGIPLTEAGALGRLDPARDALVIGASAWDSTLSRSIATLRRFVSAGGRVLVLRADPHRFNPSWLPARVQFRTEPLDHPLVYPGGRPFRNAMAINPERPDHPVFDGISRDRLFLWSDPTGWTESSPGFPEVYPVTHGFTLEDRADLARTAILANYDHGLEGVALAELFDGKGSVLLSGFGLLERVGLDPVADRLLVNLVRYLASAEPHHAHPLIDSRIVWGDYGSERGLVTGIYNGLLLHTVPVVPPDLAARYPARIDSLGFHFAGGAGGWNTRPSIQYVPKGRRPFGPYEFSLGGAVRLPSNHGPEGVGQVWFRVPQGSTRLVTTAWNPVDVPLELEVEVNGRKHRQRIAPGATERIETPLQSSETDVALTYRGDRRLVLLETEVRRGTATTTAESR